MHIRCFEGYDCKDFDDYLVATRAYFIMCHDGEDPAIHHQPCAEKAENADALYMDDEEKHNISGLDDENPSGKVRPETGAKPNEAAVSNSATFRSFISWSLSRGYTVSLINSLEFRDTKVSGACQSETLAHTDLYRSFLRYSRDRVCLDSSRPKIRMWTRSLYMI